MVRYLSLAALIFLSGCSGSYYLSVPDQLAPVGGVAAAVIRLEKSELGAWVLPVNGATMRFRVGDTQRIAYTDSAGYAGVAIPASVEPGRYLMAVEHGDKQGVEVRGEAPMYVFEPGRAMVAVDMECLPAAGDKECKAAAAALANLAGKANIIYMTRRWNRDNSGSHGTLKSGGYPDGPVLLWQEESWRFSDGRIVVEDRLVNQIGQVRRQFPKFGDGVCNSQAAARAFEQAGLRVVVVGTAQVRAANMVRRESWSQFAEAGMP
jgi:hypothetical protein